MDLNTIHRLSESKDYHKRPASYYINDKENGDIINNYLGIKQNKQTKKIACVHTWINIS